MIFPAEQVVILESPKSKVEIGISVPLFITYRQILPPVAERVGIPKTESKSGLKIDTNIW